MKTSNQLANNVAEAKAYRHPIFIDASVNHGIVSVFALDTTKNEEQDVCRFSNPANAMNYAFLLKKQRGLIIAKRALALLKHLKQSTGAIPSRAMARKTIDDIAEEGAQAFEKGAESQAKRPRKKSNRNRSADTAQS